MTPFDTRQGAASDMTFSEYLTQLIETRKLSKNMLIRETGIDRSSFFQFLKEAGSPPATSSRKLPSQQVLILRREASFTNCM
jgi:hypothetical protein